MPTREPKPKHIIMSAPMVRAILDDAQTQTRRVVKLPIWSDGRIERVERDKLRAFSRKDKTERIIECPYGPIGGMLVIRECVVLHRSIPEVVGYCADGVEATEHWMKKQSSMRMPNFAARLWLRLVDIRVQELHEIDAHDVKAEGFNCERELIELWNKLHGVGAWSVNPWVWALTFRRDKRPQVTSRDVVR
jgi:hypothetical protein